MRIYLYISIAILILYLVIGVGFSKKMTRQIALKNKTSRNDKIRACLKMITWCFVPFIRWVMVWGIYKAVTMTDQELTEMFKEKGIEVVWLE